MSVCVSMPLSLRCTQRCPSQISVTVQRLDLQRNNNDENNDNVRGQIVISLISRDRGNSGSGPIVTDASGITTSIPSDPNDLPEGYVFTSFQHLID